MSIDLSSLETKGKPKPPRIVIYGSGGIGKTTLAASAPNPVFIQAEDGLGDIKAARMPLATTYQDVKAGIIALHDQDHDYKTVVIDSLDWLEPLINKHTCQENGWSSIEDPGYGKGQVAALGWWRDYINCLNYLRDTKLMTIIQIAHYQIKRFDAPDTEPYDRYGIKLHKAAAALVQEHSDAVLFANYRVATTQSDAGFNKKITRAIGSGERVIHTNERPQHMAKNRYGMPDQLPMSWEAIAEHVPFYQPQSADVVVAA